MKKLLMTAALLLTLPDGRVEAGHLTTTPEGERAVWYAGRTWTWDQLGARRDLNPARFDANHATLGALLADPCAAIERRDLDPARFDRFHPYLGWLLGGLERPEVPPPAAPCPPAPEGPHVAAVPEPASAVLAAIAGAVLIVISNWKRGKK